MNLKTFFAAVSICFLVLSFSKVYSQANNKDPTKGQYFSVQASSNDDNIFIKLQKDNSNKVDESFKIC
jgi:hypothetical protein